MNILYCNALLSAVFVVCFCDNAIRYEGAQVLRVQPRNLRQLQALDEIEARYQPDRDDTETVSFWKRSKAIGGKSDIFVPREHLKHVKEIIAEARVAEEVLIDNVGEKIRKEHDRFKRNNIQEGFYSNYQRYDDIQERLKNLKKTHPDLVEIQVIGTSVEGRDLTIVKLKKNNGRTDKKIAYIEAGAHAREWIAPAVSMYLIEQVIKSPFMLEDTEIHVLPLLNPDGYEYTHNEKRMWRKNRSPNVGSKCIGTDLNRNFDFEWMYSDSSSVPCTDNYAGVHPASEKEVAATQMFLKSLDRLDLFISLHNYGQYWFHPWAYIDESPLNSEKMTRIGQVAVEKVKQERGIDYQYGLPADLLYAASGSSMDWVQHEISKKNPDMLSYTIELRDRGEEGFLLSSKYIGATAEDLWAGFKCIHHQLSTDKETCDY